MEPSRCRSAVYAAVTGAGLLEGLSIQGVFYVCSFCSMLARVTISVVRTHPTEKLIRGEPTLAHTKTFLPPLFQAVGILRTLLPVASTFGAGMFVNTATRSNPSARL